MIGMALPAILCLLATAAATSPQVSYPLNLQLPPVARVGEAYDFQFAATTFQPNSDSLVYSIANGPKWLRIHSENRTLWGTPEAKDVGTMTFTIAAAGKAGAVANMDSKLIIQEDQRPREVGNISQALAHAGQLSGPTTVTLLPSKPFEIVFGTEVFQQDGKNFTYYSTLEDHTPLPAWISFDSSSMRFTGTTPSSASPRTLKILLVASDPPGFGAASKLFSIVVSNHLLLFKPLMQTVNISKGEQVNIEGLKGMVFLDNAPIRDDNIQSANADVPKWLSFDPNAFDITGNPPSGLMSQDISVTVQDKFGDSAQHSIHLAFISQLFTGEVGQLNITPGIPFKYQIPKSILSLDNETISVEFGKLNRWLSFDSQSFSVSGTIPDDVSMSSVEGSMTAISPDGKVQDTQIFQIEILGSTTTKSSNPLNSATNLDHGKNENDNAEDTANSSRKKTGVVVGAVLASLFGAAVIIILALSLCRRRKKHVPGYISPRIPRSPRKTDISRPIPHPSISIVPGWGEVDKIEEEDLEKGKLEDSPSHTAELPPQLPPEKAVAHSRDTSLNEREDALWTLLGQDVALPTEAGPSHHPHDSMKIPTEIRRESANSPSQKWRQTTAVSRSSTRHSLIIAANRRLTNLDHGRHTHSISHGTNSSAAQRTLSSSSRTTAVSTVPSAFPQASKARHTTQLTTPIEKRQSIRAVVPSIYENSVDRLVDRRTLDERRHSYIRKRASAQQSPLFAGSRVSSSSFKSPPSFLGDSSPAPQSPLAVVSPDIVRPDDSILSSNNNVPESLHVRKPTDAPSPASRNFDFSKSLRKKTTKGVFSRRYTDSPSTRNKGTNEKPSARPETAVYAPTGMSSRTSTNISLRSADLMKDLNEVTGTEIWDDAALSESNYSGDEFDIEEGERRATLKPSNSIKKFIIPLDVVKQKKTASHSSSKRNTITLKKTNERDPTPFHVRNPHEHSGKENINSSLYSIPSSPPKTKPEPPPTQRSKRTSTSPPIRPKTSSGHHPVSHSRNISRNLTRSPSARTSLTSHPLPRILSTKERHSSRSIHSRSRSRHSAALPKKPCERSHTQDSAYLFFPPTEKDADARSSIVATTRRSKILTTDSTTENNSGETTDSLKRMQRENQRQSRLTQLHRSSPFYHSKRDTGGSSVPSTPVQTASVGLGLSLLRGGLEAEDATPGPESAGKGDSGRCSGRVRERERARTPLSVLGVGNEGSPERKRVTDGKGKRPVDVDGGEEAQKGKGFGSWKDRVSIWGNVDAKAFI